MCRSSYRWGGEFQGKSSDLLVQALIDHRITSANHPQANGSAERAVQTIKQGILRTVLDTKQDWDEALAWVTMGYRVTPQASTGLTPFEMMYSVAPIVPPSVRENFTEFDLVKDDPVVMGESLRERALALQQACVIAGGNLLIAQHRDTLRYAKLRSGGYLPSLVNYQVGDYVYVKATNKAGSAPGPKPLVPHARPEILRVFDVRPSGVLVLIGADDHTVSENVLNVSPCQLPVIEPLGRKRLNRALKEHHCEICMLPDQEAVMVCCDSCDRGFHSYWLRLGFALPHLK